MVVTNTYLLYQSCEGKRLTPLGFNIYDLRRLELILQALMKASGHTPFVAGREKHFSDAKVSDLKKHLRRDPQIVSKYLQDLPTSSPKAFRQGLLDCWLDHTPIIFFGSCTTQSKEEHAACMYQLVKKQIEEKPIFVGRFCGYCKQHEPENNKYKHCSCLAGTLEA